MKTEIEVKFLNVDIDNIRERLKAAGAHLEQPMRLMRRQVFYIVDRSKDAYLRVRDEGNKVTMTYKQFDAISVDGAKEVEVVVSDFEQTVDIIKRSGVEPKSYQETKRETWRLENTEIVIDEWPWLAPFIEIEGESEQALQSVATKLGLVWDSAVFGAATQAYRASYPDINQNFIMDDLPEIRFDLPLPDRLKGGA